MVVSMKDILQSGKVWDKFVNSPFDSWLNRHMPTFIVSHHWSRQKQEEYKIERSQLWWQDLKALMIGNEQVFLDVLSPRMNPDST